MEQEKRRRKLAQELREALEQRHATQNDTRTRPNESICYPCALARERGLW